MAKILGLSYAYHDSAAALIIDGKTIASAQEERFNRIKHYADFPIQSINYCLQEANITSQDLDYIVFYERPFSKFLRNITGHLHGFPYSYKHFRQNIPTLVDKRLSIDFEIKNELCYEKNIYFIPHHLSHAASAFLSSPFENSAILISDGVGEKATISYGIGNRNNISMINEMHFPNSIGLLYSAITSYLGFSANSGEGKTMGLADHGVPEYYEELLSYIDIHKDGSFSFNTKMWNFFSRQSPVTKRFIKRFGKPRKSSEPILDHHKNMAASIQKLTEHLLVKIANHVHSETQSDNICLAGGSFLNIPTNSKIIEETPFKNIFVQPAASDAGGALGAALWCQSMINPDLKRSPLKKMYLGPQFSSNDIKLALIKNNVDYRQPDYDELIDQTAKSIVNNKIVAWFQGRMELGPRALGRRSILVNPCCKEMKDTLNLNVKHRESFRPYGVSILSEKIKEYFEIPPHADFSNISPYMLMVAEVKKDKLDQLTSATHINNTSRVQSVLPDDGVYYDLLKRLDKKYNLPMVINTSFNHSSEPIVCTPDNAIKTFLENEIDILVIGDYICEKS